MGKHLNETGTIKMSFTELLQRGREAARTRIDPWRLRLERVRGKVWEDRIERISTQALFDILEVPQKSRSAGACRRLAKLMRELGWHPVKARGLNQFGVRDQIRGYARDTTRSAVF
jgi:hypothetical protein